MKGKIMNRKIVTFYIEQAKEKFNSLYNREIKSINVRKKTNDKVFVWIECIDKISNKKHKVIISVKRITLAENLIN